MNRIEMDERGCQAINRHITYGISRYKESVCSDALTLAF
jgi:hypothetical protein